MPITKVSSQPPEFHILPPPPGFCPLIRSNTVAKDTKSCSKPLAFYAHLHPPPGFRPIIRMKAVQEEEDDDPLIDIDKIADHDTVPVCPSLTKEFFQNLRLAEFEHRPSTNYMENVQIMINARSRSFIIDYMVRVAKIMKFSEETLHLSVNYLDRYLSGNQLFSLRELTLVSIACMRVAWKHEDDIGTRTMDAFLFLTEEEFSPKEILRMERRILDFLNFDLTVPTAVHFVPRFNKAAKRGIAHEDTLMECLAEYISELSLYSYNMLRFLPSMVAASSVFLAKYVQAPNSKKPWNSTLRHYTLYRASDLRECVMELHKVLILGRHDECTRHIREKYSGSQYMSASSRYCRPSIRPEVFEDVRR